MKTELMYPFLLVNTKDFLKFLTNIAKTASFGLLTILQLFGSVNSLMFLKSTSETTAHTESYSRCRRTPWGECLTDQNSDSLTASVWGLPARPGRPCASPASVCKLFGTHLRLKLLLDTSSFT